MQYLGNGLWDTGCSHLPPTTSHLPLTTEHLLDR